MQIHYQNITEKDLTTKAYCIKEIISFTNKGGKKTSSTWSFKVLTTVAKETCYLLNVFGGAAALKLEIKGLGDV